MPDFYMILPERYFPEFGGGEGGSNCPLPPSPTPMVTTSAKRWVFIQI